MPDSAPAPASPVPADDPLTAALEEGQRIADALAFACRDPARKPDFFACGGPAAEAYWDYFTPARISSLLAAVRAVLELHQPVTTNGGWLEGREWQECEECGPNNENSGVFAAPGDGEEFWPCPTVEAITRELSGKEEP